eukprot:1156053-Pelagomonas_calceolata.AAC.1
MMTSCPLYLSGAGQKPKEAEDGAEGEEQGEGEEAVQVCGTLNAQKRCCPPKATRLGPSMPQYKMSKQDDAVTTTGNVTPLRLVWRTGP